MRTTVISSRTLALVLVLLVIVAYGGCVNYPFVYDDLSGIVDNPLINGAETVAQASRALLETWRPATRFTYALTHALFGFSKPAFHATNLAAHILNTLLVFGIAIRLAKRWMPGFNPAHFGFAAGMIHAVHPLYTEAVTYISGRSSSLRGLFYFGCLFLVMRAVESRNTVPQSLWFGAAAISGVLAWEAKEEAITLPIIVAIFLILAGFRKPAAALMALPLAVVVAHSHAIASLYRTSVANEGLVNIGMGTRVETLPYVLTEIKAAVFYYMSQFVVPLTQSVDPYFRTVQSIFEPGFLIAVAILAILVVIAVRSSRRQPVLTFSIAALLVSPLLAYAVIPVPDLVAEHRIYVAGLGFDLLIAWMLTRAPRLMLPSIAVLAMALTASTIVRNSVWGSEVTLWRQAERNSGRNQIRPHLNLGAAFQVAGQFDAALEEYRHSLSIRQDLPLVYSNMGTIYLGQARFDEAEAMLKRAVELSPSMSQPYINLASIDVHRKKADEALEYASKAERAGAAAYWVHFVRAEALTLTGQFDAARAEYEIAAKLSEGHRALHDEIQSRLSALRSQTGSVK